MALGTEYGNGYAGMACPTGLNVSAGCPICGGNADKCVGQRKQGTDGVMPAMPPSDMRKTPSGLGD